MKRRFAGWSGARGAVGSALLLVTIAVLSACGGRNGQGSPPSFDAARSYTVPYGESAVVAISDLDGDGRPDLVAANYLNLLADEEDNSVSVLLNRGDGSFRASRDYRSAYGAASVAIGDVNGDSRPDLAQMGTGTVSVFINKGNGSFHARREYRTGIGADAYPIAIGDLNGDGKLDLVTAKVAADRPGAVSVLLNWGDGNSQAKLAYRTIFGRDLHDLNGDGKPDLVFENCDDADSVSVLLNRGDGSFRARQDYPTPSAPCGLAIGDLNGDGKPDLAIANYDSDTVSVLLNRGDGSFQAKVDYATRLSPESVAIGDLDGDGKPDLVTANEDDPGGVSVLLNKGDGSFRTKLDYGTWSAYSVAIGDLNGDGKPDLVTGNEGNTDSGANTVSVLLSKTGE